MDAYSRTVVGWRLSRWSDAELVTAALEKALASRRPEPGWLHHSDRGVQCAGRQDIERLAARGAAIRTSRRGRRGGNARADAFLRTLKREEVLLTESRGFEEAEANLARLVDEVYLQRG